MILVITIIPTYDKIMKWLLNITGIRLKKETRNGRVCIIMFATPNFPQAWWNWECEPVSSCYLLYNITILSIYRFSSLYYLLPYRPLLPINPTKILLFLINHHFQFPLILSFLNTKNIYTMFPLHTYNNIISGFGCSD